MKNFLKYLSKITPDNITDEELLKLEFLVGETVDDVEETLTSLVEELKDFDDEDFESIAVEYDSILPDSKNGYKRVQVVRDGRKVWINKKIGAKKRLSAKQRNALRKARLKAHTGQAKTSRKRSLGKRKTFGMK